MARAVPAGQPIAAHLRPKPAVLARPDVSAAAEVLRYTDPGGRRRSAMLATTGGIVGLGNLWSDRPVGVRILQSTKSPEAQYARRRPRSRDRCARAVRQVPFRRDGTDRDPARSMGGRGEDRLVDQHPAVHGGCDTEVRPSRCPCSRPCWRIITFVAGIVVLPRQRRGHRAGARGTRRLSRWVALTRAIFCSGAFEDTRQTGVLFRPVTNATSSCSCCSSGK